MYIESYLTNLLSMDGIAIYYGKFLTFDEANGYFHSLLQNIPWKNDEVVVFGKHIVTKRKTAWYGDSNYVYIYSNTIKQALSWTRELINLKHLVENLSNTKFNSCLLNLYHDGNEGMGWHSDDEKSIEENSTIASVSFGAERKFSFKHKQNKKIISVSLEHGSLLLMKEVTQKNWLHSLPKSKKITLPRINLTFRRMVT
ncbi:MAG TPA: alpha-ketoglutarate-dependent dioxygenase AlkB [Nitrososphaeraceae archaeon]|nr:alpha-ketoglutarate-dependent dioxygenase AlkB [Nitrososphaeraceae archaeon]